MRTGKRSGKFRQGKGVIAAALAVIDPLVNPLVLHMCDHFQKVSYFNVFLEQSHVLLRELSLNRTWQIHEKIKFQVTDPAPGFL